MSDIRNKIIGLKNFMDARIIGQKDLVNKLIITLLADGNALVEGAPGLAKTKAIKTLASSIFRSVDIVLVCSLDAALLFIFNAIPKLID